MTTYAHFAAQVGILYVCTCINVPTKQSNTAETWVWLALSVAIWCRLYTRCHAVNALLVLTSVVILSSLFSFKIHVIHVVQMSVLCLESVSNVYFGGGGDVPYAQCRLPRLTTVKICVRYNEPHLSYILSRSPLNKLILIISDELNVTKTNARVQCTSNIHSSEY